MRPGSPQHRKRAGFLASRSLVQAAPAQKCTDRLIDGRSARLQASSSGASTGTPHRRCRRPEGLWHSCLCRIWPTHCTLPCCHAGDAGHDRSCGAGGSAAGLLGWPVVGAAPPAAALQGGDTCAARPGRLAVVLAHGQCSNCGLLCHSTMCAVCAGHGGVLPSIRRWWWRRRARALVRLQSWLIAWHGAMASTCRSLLHLAAANRFT